VKVPSTKKAVNLVNTTNIPIANMEFERW
jgi:hypothetical protein